MQLTRPQSYLPPSCASTCSSSARWLPRRCLAATWLRCSLQHLVPLQCRGQRPRQPACNLRISSGVVRAASGSVKEATYAPQSAKDAVEKGLEIFAAREGEGSLSEALRLFQAALELQPSDDEARAALYNSACCYAKLKRWQPAVDAVVAAVNDYDLKLSVAVKDPDLGAMRERREWLDALDGMKGSISDAALVQLRSEAKAPFRLARTILEGGLLAGATVGLIVIIALLVGTLQRGDDPTEGFKNLAINGISVVVLSFLLQRDLKSSARDRAVVKREEALARLQVSTETERLLSLAAFRGALRPVLIAGSRSYLQKVQAAAEPFKADLQDRAIALVLLPLDVSDPAAKLRALKQQFKAEKESKGFGGRSPAPVEGAPRKAKAMSKQDLKWQLQPYDVPEWIEWVDAQKVEAGVSGDNSYFQIALDGTVRASGLGIPPWDRFVGDLAPLDDIRTKMTRQ